MRSWLPTGVRGLSASCFLALCLFTATANAANELTTIATPNGGQPLGARVDDRGTIHLIYNSAAGPQYVASTNGGKTLSKPISVLGKTAPPRGLEYLAWDMAVSPQGHVHVAMGTNAWKLKLPKEEWGFFYANLLPGDKEFSAVRNINRKPSEGFSLAADAKGHVTACWMAGKLYAQTSSDNGQTFAPAVEIDPAFDPCDCCTTNCTYGADGRLAILYREETNNERDMYLILWDQLKNDVKRTRVSTTPWSIDTCPMTYYTVVARGEGYVAVWPTKGPIYFANLGSDGSPLLPTEVKTPGTTAHRTGMIALPTTSDGTLVTWNHDNQVHWQLYNKAGAPQGRGGATKTNGKGAAAVVTKSGEMVVFY
jgi:hypothetical protein